MQHPVVGWFAWATIETARQATISAATPYKNRRLGAAERGTRRSPGFQDHYSIRKCSDDVGAIFEEGASWSLKTAARISSHVVHHDGGSPATAARALPRVEA